MVRSPTVDKNGIRRGAWSEEEDNKLKAYVLRYGHWNWRQLPRFAGLARCGKSCRLRWKNYLKPGLRRGSFTEQEVELIIKLREQFGNKWSLIASKLPGRTDNEIKNYWHAHLKERIKQDPLPTNSKRKTSDRFDQMHVMDSVVQVSTSVPRLQRTQKGEFNTNAADPSADISSMNNSSTFFEHNDSMGSFNGRTPMDVENIPDCWVQNVVDPFGGYSVGPFSLDTASNLISPPTSCNSAISEESFTGTYGNFWTEPLLLDTSSSQISPSASTILAQSSGLDWELDSLFIDYHEACKVDAMLSATDDSYLLSQCSLVYSLNDNGAQNSFHMF